MQFLFADHTLDTDRRELRRGGEPIDVEPQVLDVLIYLVENRERVVSKDALIASVWAGRIVSDATLSSRIYSARKALRAYILGTSGAGAAQMLADFGMVPPKPMGRRSVQVKAQAATQAAARARLGLPTDRLILLSVRRLVRRMGLSELIVALKTIVKSVPDVLLCIAGRGLLREELEQRVVELGLTDHVRFLGYVDDDDLPYLYRAANINVVPTVALEGFGLVAAESLAAGVPAMVTKVGGLPEVVAGLSPDLMFASPRAEDLANGLIQALTGHLRLPDADACAAYAKKHYRSQLMADRIAAVYREIL